MAGALESLDKCQLNHAKSPTSYPESIFMVREDNPGLCDDRLTRPDSFHQVKFTFPAFRGSDPELQDS
jgi:hypothetical protein